MYGYRYTYDEELNQLIMDYASEFDVTYIGYFNHKHVFQEFGRNYEITENKMRSDLKNHLKECGS